MAPLSLLIAVLAIFGIVGSFNGSFGPGLRIGLTGAVTLNGFGGGVDLVGW